MGEWALIEGRKCEVCVEGNMKEKKRVCSVENQ